MISTPSGVSARRPARRRMKASSWATPSCSSRASRRRSRLDGGLGALAHAGAHLARARRRRARPRRPRAARRRGGRCRRRAAGRARSRASRSRRARPPRRPSAAAAPGGGSRAGRGRRRRRRATAATAVWHDGVARAGVGERRRRATIDDDAEPGRAAAAPSAGVLEACAPARTRRSPASRCRRGWRRSRSAPPSRDQAPAMIMPATVSAVAARTTSPAVSHRWSARERSPHWRASSTTVATASSDPPVSSATRNDGASTDMRSHGTATTASETAAAPAAANDTVGSAGLRAGPCSICSTLRTSEPGGVVPEAINPAQGAVCDRRRRTERNAHSVDDTPKFGFSRSAAV